MYDEKILYEQGNHSEHNNHQFIKHHQGRNIQYDYEKIHGAKQDLRKTHVKPKPPVMFAHSLGHHSMDNKAPNIQDPPRFFQAVIHFSTRFRAFISFQYSNTSHTTGSNPLTHYLFTFLATHPKKLLLDYAQESFTDMVSILLMTR